jgi:leader peptidase (prepilin peptidase)/N-methyltransferase
VVAGCIITGGLFFIVAWVSYAVLGRTGLGGGDIKLAGVIGAALGASGGLLAAFVGIMLGGVVAAVLLVSGRRRFGEYLPFGPFLAAGGIVAAVWGRPIMEWYLG